MKILMIAPYVTITSRPEFSRNKTGFGYMVMDIASAVAYEVKSKSGFVDLLTTDSRGSGFFYRDVRVLPRNMMRILANVHNNVHLSNVTKLMRTYHIEKASSVRLYYYWMMSGYVKDIIKKGGYDIVHIHGCNYATELWMEICHTLNQRYIITLHGLNSFSDTVALNNSAKEYERNFLRRVVEDGIPITVISTGMKQLIEKTYNNGRECNNISVICNAFSFSNSNTDTAPIDIKTLHGVSAIEKVVICVGNICKRKNQGQLIRAFDLLKEELAMHTYLFFLGNSLDDNYSIDKLSSNSPWRSHFIKCGIVPKEIVKYYYEQSDAIALMSLSEGFGLSLIEGMHFGKPCMSFKDVDAFMDIYNPDAMIGVGLHSDEAVAQGLEVLLTKEWDEGLIKKHSEKFDSTTMAKGYIDTFKRIQL